MAKLNNYKGSVEVHGGLKPKNNNDFPLMEAHSIVVDDGGTRLDDKLEALGKNAGNVVGEVSQNADAETIAKRSSYGSVRTQAPVEATDSVNLEYLEQAILEASGTITGSKTLYLHNIHLYKGSNFHVFFKIPSTNFAKFNAENIGNFIFESGGVMPVSGYVTENNEYKPVSDIAHDGTSNMSVRFGNEIYSYREEWANLNCQDVITEIGTFGGGSSGEGGLPENPEEIKSNAAPFLISKVDENGTNRATLVLGEPGQKDDGSVKYKAGVQAESVDLKAYEIDEDGKKVTKAGVRVSNSGVVYIDGQLGLSAAEEDGIAIIHADRKLVISTADELGSERASIRLGDPVSGADGSKFQMLQLSAGMVSMEAFKEKNGSVFADAKARVTVARDGTVRIKGTLCDEDGNALKLEAKETDEEGNTVTEASITVEKQGRIRMKGTLVDEEGNPLLNGGGNTFEEVNVTTYDEEEDTTYSAVYKSDGIVIDRSYYYITTGDNCEFFVDDTGIGYKGHTDNAASLHIDGIAQDCNGYYLFFQYPQESGTLATQEWVQENAGGSAKLYQHNVWIQCNDGQTDYSFEFAFTNAKAVISYTDLYGVRAVAVRRKVGVGDTNVEYIGIHEEDDETLYISGDTDYYADITNTANITIETTEI